MVTEPYPSQPVIYYQSLSRGFYPKPLTVNVRLAFRCSNERVAVGGGDTAVGRPKADCVTADMEELKPEPFSWGSSTLTDKTILHPQTCDVFWPLSADIGGLVAWYESP